MRQIAVLLSVLGALLLPPPVEAKCHTRACWKRVRMARLFHRYPMPWCSWGPESRGDYRARNPQSTAGGKYQIIRLTWYAYGGDSWHGVYPAAYAPRVQQERVARRIAYWGWHGLRPQGFRAWVNC
jgi:hypothetical protein